VKTLADWNCAREIKALMQYYEFGIGPEAALTATSASDGQSRNAPSTCGLRSQRGICRTLTLPTPGQAAASGKSAPFGHRPLTTGERWQC
jgi:hypothetical protein